MPWPTSGGPAARPERFRAGSARALFGGSEQRIRAVDDVSFSVRKGENFGLVGESGSGKTTVAKLILRLESPTEGSVLFRGADVHGLTGSELKDFRGATHIVFQDPNSSLSPRLRVRDIVGEPLVVQGIRGDELERRIIEVLEMVGLRPEVAHRYPHEFSGGQRQRVAIARAVAPRPALIVLDEPVSALDVSIRAQILNLLKSLQDELDLTYLTIAHDLAVVYQACDRTGVMYVGKLVELAGSDELYKNPLHPYTRVLLASRVGGLPGTPLPALDGSPPRLDALPPGCAFAPRCPYAEPTCRADIPDRDYMGERSVRCFRAGVLELRGVGGES